MFFFVDLGWYHPSVSGNLLVSNHVWSVCTREDVSEENQRTQGIIKNFKLMDCWMMVWWWFDGLMVGWFDGLMDWWFDGLMVWWFDGLMDWWFDGLMDWWFDGFQDRKLQNIRYPGEGGWFLSLDALRGKYLWYL